MEKQERNIIWSLLVRKLTNEATKEELEELEKYMQSHKGMHNLNEQLQEYWNSRPEHDEDFLEATYILHKNKMSSHGIDIEMPDEQEAHAFTFTHYKWIKKSLLKGLITAIFLIGIGLFIFLHLQKKEQTLSATSNRSNEVKTQKGNRTQVILPDGSNVWLNAESKLDYHKDFGTNLREVYLTGEAFFDVVKNPDKPFIVHTRAADIRVLGTAFNVKSYPGEKITETSLIRGRVEITLPHKPDEKWILNPNEKLLLQDDKDNKSIAAPNKSLQQVQNMPTTIIIKKPLTYEAGDTTAIEVAWTNNIITFNDETFEEVAGKLSRWFDVEFEFKNPQLKQLVMHNSFKNESLDQVLESLEYSFGFHHKKAGKKIILY